MMPSDQDSFFNAFYYREGCGRPYQRDNEWLNFFDGIAEKIVQEINPRTVLDAGCAMGFLVEGLRKRGVDAYGIDISEYAISQAHESIRPYLCVGSVANPFPQRYDLIVSIEVLEHMPHTEAEKAVINFTHYADDILFSSTPFDYKEVTHFNVQVPEYWVEQFARQQFYRELDFDASFITQWAFRVRKNQIPTHRLVREYEKKFFVLWKETADLRLLALDLRRDNEQMQQQLSFTRQHELTLQSDMSQMENQILDYQDRWNTLENSLEWRIFEKLRKIAAVALPIGSKRRIYAGKGVRFVKKLFTRPPRIPKTIPAQKHLTVHNNPPQLKLALYTTDAWVTASTYMRFVAPSGYLDSGITLIDGIQSGGEIHFDEACDAVVIHRDFPRHTENYNLVIKWAHQHEKPVLYELDDLLFEVPDSHPEYSYYAKSKDAILNAVRNSDGVICSTIDMAEYLRNYNKNVWVIPNYLVEGLWNFPNIHQKTADPVVLGYMGGATHAPDIEFIRPVLHKLLEKYRGHVKLRFWGIAPEELAQHPDVEWSKQTFPDYAAFAQYFVKQRADIFLAPLLPGLFNACKSHIKYLEYSALGAPGVYSRISPYERIITPGYDGFLASSLDEWEKYLMILIENSALRAQMGKNAQQRILSHFLLKDHLLEWNMIYRAALMRSQTNGAQNV